MDILEACSQMAPVPYLKVGVTIIREMMDSIQGVKICRNQLQDLARSMASILSFLHDQNSKRPNMIQSTTANIEKITKIYLDISHFVQRKAGQNFFKMLFTKDDIQLSIENYRRLLKDQLDLLMLDSQINIQHLLRESLSARDADKDEIRDHIYNVLSRQDGVLDMIKQVPAVPLAAALQRRIEEKQGDPQELQLYTESLKLVKARRKIDLRGWMISSLEVEYDDEPLFSGGFGKVHNGRWNGVQVAVKVMKNGEGCIPQEDSIRREAEVWHRLKHPNILPFLGVSITGETPFIVMPLLEHGNVRRFLNAHPHCDRLKIIREVSLGIEYLHSKDIIHGDLKAANILIDDGMRAVICDFGLSRIKDDVDSQTKMPQSRSIHGSLPWMAPERLLGGRLQPPCDIYSFGMTIYEIYINEAPFPGSLSESRLVELVVERGIRPERPTLRESPELIDDLWNIVVDCWNQNPSARPTSTSVRDRLHFVNRMPASADHVRPAPAKQYSTPNPITTPADPFPYAVYHQRARSANAAQFLSRGHGNGVSHSAPTSPEKHVYHYEEQQPMNQHQHASMSLYQCPLPANQYQAPASMNHYQNTPPMNQYHQPPGNWYVPPPKKNSALRSFVRQLSPQLLSDRHANNTYTGAPSSSSFADVAYAQPPPPPY